MPCSFYERHEIWVYFRIEIYVPIWFKYKQHNNTLNTLVYSETYNHKEIR